MKLRAVVIAAGVTAALLLPLGTPAQAAAVEQIRLTFDTPPSGQAEPGPWTTGCFADSAGTPDNPCINVANGGKVGRVQRGTSPAIKFPAPGAGQVMLSAPHQAYLTPGTANFSISAIVNLKSTEVSAGANVVQKGLHGNTAGQWKLQVDSGKPSCKVRGTRPGSTTVSEALAKSPESIAGAGWKTIKCVRTGSNLSVLVNGVTMHTVSTADLNITNTAAVTLGAKNLTTTNDQFHGAVDNVIFSVG